MESEKVDNKPMEKNEIIRFLEASRSSRYNPVPSILSSKEKSFQQRTLLEIASETEARLKINQDTENNSSALDESELLKADENINSDSNIVQVSEEEKKEEERKAQALEQEKIAAEQTLAEQEKIKKEYYDRGYYEGKKALEAESSEKLNIALDALENTKKSMLNLNATHFIDLREQISQSILALASERAGVEIKNLPELFIKKIEALIESIDQKTRKPIIYLNPEDLESLSNVLNEKEEISEFIFKPNSDLVHGDMIVDLGSIKAKDLSSLRADGNYLSENDNDFKASFDKESVGTDGNPQEKPSKAKDQNLKEETTSAMAIEGLDQNEMEKNNLIGSGQAETSEPNIKNPEEKVELIDAKEVLPDSKEISESTPVDSNQTETLEPLKTNPALNPDPKAELTISDETTDLDSTKSKLDNLNETKKNLENKT